MEANERGGSPPEDRKAREDGLDHDGHTRSERDIERDIDEEVADMTDALLQKRSPGVSVYDETPLLMNVVSQLADVLAQPPPASFAERLSKRLDQEWASREQQAQAANAASEAMGEQSTHSTAQASSNPSSSALLPPLRVTESRATRAPEAGTPQTTRRPSLPTARSRRIQWTIPAFAAAVVTLIVVSTLLAPGEQAATNGLTGATVGGLPAELALMLLVLVVGAALFAWWRRR